MPKTRFVGFRVDAKLWEEFKKSAERKHATASELLRAFIRKEVLRS